MLEVSPAGEDGLTATGRGGGVADMARGEG